MTLKDRTVENPENAKMKVKLIMPTWLPPAPFVPPFPPLALAILAAETPPDMEVIIVDENMEDIDFEEDVDLVGITAFTYQAKRAYEIAAEFRKKNIKVVMGGMHSSSIPEEALQYADSVVIGEAEGVWKEVIEDFRKGNLKKKYKAREYGSMVGFPIPRRDLFRREKYVFRNTVITARGCPFECDFCIVPCLFGTAFRHRPIEETVGEIKMLIEGRRGFDRFVYLLDDNIGFPHEYYEALFKALIPLRIKWMGEASVKIAEDEEVLELAAKSGCSCLMLGFESLSAKNLDEHRKSHLNPSTFEEAVKKIHSFGITVFGFFIFGFNNDDETVFKRTIEWAQKNHIEAAQLAPLYHFPGSETYEKNKDTLVNEKWWMDERLDIDYTPPSMSKETLKAGVLWANKEYNSPVSILKRILRSPDKFFALYMVSSIRKRTLSALKTWEKDLPSGAYAFIER